MGILCALIFFFFFFFFFLCFFLCRLRKMRTSNFFVPTEEGTDIPFLGGKGHDSIFPIFRNSLLCKKV